ncbi:ribosome maturation factor RimP [Alkalicoccus saliphilus]|jgi:ribosome maturation factor RimP|uniref:Ribosome maturation factor RimP n=1 Tax=Alkalicoccus saliphilus TaxID=200989 RepID=A0A2T4U896_9BACI|nr:ribosome maturation factor RimP [Alkalicoccus saliphilus]PTL39623.1 ribosome maturation factor RimP [Alkalicoccus saliphilus]
MSNQIYESVEKLVLPILEEENLELVDIEFEKEGKNWFLRVFIDSDNGVDLDDCTKVSEQLSEMLDKKDPIEQAYYLEVSSPGAERPLKKKKDVEKAVGSNIYVTTYAPVEGEKAFEGTLASFEDDVLKMEVKVKTRVVVYEIPYSQVAKARLAVAF